MQCKFLAPGSAQGNLIINESSEIHTWVFLVPLCIALLFLSTLPPQFCCGFEHSGVFYSLLCSLRQQLCPRSALAALQSGRLPQTTPHSGDEPSSDLVCTDTDKGWSCTALPGTSSKHGTPFWHSTLATNNREVFSPFYSCCDIGNPSYHTLNILQLLSNTAVLFYIQHNFFIFS